MGRYTRSKKGRSASRYPQRLAARGLSATPRMTGYRHADPKQDRPSKTSAPRDEQ